MASLPSSISLAKQALVEASEAFKNHNEKGAIEILDRQLPTLLREGVVSENQMKEVYKIIFESPATTTSAFLKREWMRCANPSAPDAADQIRGLALEHLSKRLKQLTPAPEPLPILALAKAYREHDRESIRKSFEIVFPRLLRSGLYTEAQVKEVYKIILETPALSTSQFLRNTWNQFHADENPDEDKMRAMALEMLSRHLEALNTRRVSPRFVLDKQTVNNVAGFAERGDTLSLILGTKAEISKVNLARGNDNVLQELQYLKGLTEFDANSVREFMYKESERGTAALIPIFQNNPHLVSIGLAHYCVDDAVLRTLGQTCHKLRDLNIAGCNGYNAFTLEGFKALLAGCPLLRSLDLRWCFNVDGNFIQALADSAKQLQRLNLQNIQSRITNGDVGVLAQGCPLLRELHLYAAGHDINGYSLRCLGKYCHELQILNMQSLLIDDEGVEALAQGCHDLRELNFNNCWKLTDRSLIALGKNCHELEVLDIGGNENVTISGIEAIVQGCPNLREIHFNVAYKTTITEDQVADLLERYPHLQKIKFNRYFV